MAERDGLQDSLQSQGTPQACFESGLLEEITLVPCSCIVCIR